MSILTFSEGHFLDSFPRNGFTRKLIKGFITEDGREINLKFVTCQDQDVHDTILVRDVKGYFKIYKNILRELDNLIEYLNYETWFLPSVQPYRDIAIVRRCANKLGYLSDYSHFNAWKYKEAWDKEIEVRLGRLRLHKEWSKVVNGQIVL